MAQILAFLVSLGQAMQAFSVPCLWVGWWLWRAGFISQDTYLLYYNFYNYHNDYGPQEVARQEAYERQLQQQAEHERQLQVSKLSK